MQATPQLLTLYAKAVLPKDPQISSTRRQLARDVVIYKDRTAQVLFARFDYDSRHKPDRRDKAVTIQGLRYGLEWI